MIRGFGITERGDGGLDQSWREKAKKWELDGLIIITKAPQLITDLPDNALIHCTITGLGGTYVEPNVRSTGVTLPAYKQLVERYGGERIVLRIDPIIPTKKGIETALKVFAHRQGRVRISFLDLYPHICHHFAGRLDWDSFHAPLHIRKQVVVAMPGVEICGEPGLECTGCISARDYGAIGLAPPNIGRSNQRSTCMCLGTKTELLGTRKPCAHSCIYCYWR